MTTTDRLPVTGDDEADRLLVADPVVVGEGQTLRVIEEGNTTPTTLGPTDVTPGVIAFPEPGAVGLLAVSDAGVKLSPAT